MGLTGVDPETGKEVQGRVFWNTLTAQEKEIEIGPKAFTLIQVRLEQLNKQEELKEEHIALYDKFTGEK